MNVLQLLKFEEGFRSKPYYCSEGFPTVGIGKKIGPKNAPLDLYQFTVPEEVALEWVGVEVCELLKVLNKEEWFMALSSDNKSIILSMAYQIGITGLFKFKRMIAALSIGDFEEAVIEAKDSLWYRQTKSRAVRHCRVLAGESIRAVYRV